MKILFCINNLSARGGIERVTIVKANALAEIPGNEVHVCSTERGAWPDTICPLSDKVCVHFLDTRMAAFNWRNYLGNWLRLRSSLKRLIGQIRPDVAVTTGQQERNALAFIRLQGGGKNKGIPFQQQFQAIQRRDGL